MSPVAQQQPGEAPSTRPQHRGGSSFLPSPPSASPGSSSKFSGSLYTLPLEAEFLENELSALPEWREDQPRLTVAAVDALIRNHPAQVVLPSLYKRLRAFVAYYLTTAPRPASLRILHTIASCCSTGTLYHHTSHSESSLRVAPRFCRHRLCPQCSSAAAARTRHALLDKLQGLKLHPHERLVHAVLSFPSVPLHRLREACQSLTGAFAEVRAQTWFSERCRGGFWALEITRNKESGLFHPHLHAILVTAFLDRNALTVSMTRAAGAPCRIWLNATYQRNSDSDRELAAEACKSAEAFHKRNHLPDPDASRTTVAEDAATYITKHDAVIPDQIPDLAEYNKQISLLRIHRCWGCLSSAAIAAASDPTANHEAAQAYALFGTERHVCSLSQLAAGLRAQLPVVRRLAAIVHAALPYRGPP